MAQAIQSWSNPLPTRVGQDLELILNSLTEWLQNPTFVNGVTVGNSTPATYDPSTGAQTAPAPTTLVTIDSLKRVVPDTSTPSTPTITAVGGLRSVIAYWDGVQTASGLSVASYVAQIATDSAFTAIVQTLKPVGPVASFNGLTSNTAYYVRVAGVSTGGTQGAWSATASVTTAQVSGPDIAANSIVAGSAIIGNAAISSAQIASITANQIVAGTINAQTIQLGTSGGAAAIQSTDYVAGSTGWVVKGDGSAEFSNLTIRGATISGGTFQVGDLAGGGAGAVRVWSDGADGVIDLWYNGVNTGRLWSGVIPGESGNSGGNINIESTGGKIYLVGSEGKGHNALATLADGSVDGQIPLLQSGSSTVTPNSSGYASFTFSLPFPNLCGVVLAQAADNTGAEGSEAEMSSFGTSSATIRIVNASGVPVTSGSWTIHWMAMGY